MGLRFFSVETRAQVKGADTWRGMGRNAPKLESVEVILGHWSFSVTWDPLGKNWTRGSVQLLNLLCKPAPSPKIPVFSL